MELSDASDLFDEYDSDKDAEFDVRAEARNLSRKRLSSVDEDLVNEFLDDVARRKAKKAALPGKC